VLTQVNRPSLCVDPLSGCRLKLTDDLPRQGRGVISLSLGPLHSALKLFDSHPLPDHLAFGPGSPLALLDGLTGLLISAILGRLKRHLKGRDERIGTPLARPIQ
jgi:hypothetical protein